MAKGRKSGTSSASSATRKKQAAQAAKKADKRSRDLQALATLDEALAGGAFSDAAGGPTPDAAPKDELAQTPSPSTASGTAVSSARGMPQQGKPAPTDKTKAKQGKAAHMSKRQKREAKAKNKQYIPPAKVQGVLDPLDTLGLAHQLPADLVVLLRKAGKKDLVTRQRALEGLKDYFEYGLAHLHDDDGPYDYESALVLMLPSWVHVFPRLSVSPTRRLRQLSAQIMGLLVSSEVTGPELLGTPEHTEAILGPWSLLAFDTDSAVANAAFPAFEKHVYFASPPSSGTSVQLTGDLGQEFVNHLRRAIVTPLDVFTAQVDAAPSGASTPLRDAKNRDEAVEESIEATCARIVAAALGSLAWAVAKNPAFGRVSAESQAPELDANIEALFNSDELWDCFHPPSSSARPSPAQALAGASPQIRSRAWSLLSALRNHHTSLLQGLLGLGHSTLTNPPAEGEEAARTVQLLRDAWSEHDTLPFQLMLEAIVPLLRAFPQVWFLTAGDDTESEEDEEDPEEVPVDSADEASMILASPVWKIFVRWIQTACAGQPTRGAPTLVLFASTLPSCAWAPASPAAQQLRSALFAAFTRALDPVSVALDAASRKALIEGECEVIIYAARQILQAPSAGDDETRIAAAQELVQSSLGGLLTDMLNSDAASTTRTGPAAAARQRQNHAWLLQQSVKTLRSLAPRPGAGVTVDLLPSFLSSAIQSAAQTQQAGAAANVEAIVEIVALLAAPAPAGAPDTKGAAVAALSDVADLATSDLLQLDETNSQDSSKANERFQLLTTLVARLPTSLVSSSEAAHLLHRLTNAAEAGLELAILRQEDGKAPGASPTLAMSFIADLLPKLAAAPELPFDLPSFWMKLTGAIARLPDLKAQVTALAPLLRLSGEVENKLLPSDDAQRAVMLAPLDHTASKLAEELLGPSVSNASPEAIEVLLRLVRKPLPFIDPQVTQQVIVQAVTWVDYDLRDLISLTKESGGDHRLSLAQQILSVGDPAEVASAGDMAELFPTAFVAAHCLDPSRVSPHAIEVASKLWSITYTLPADVQANVTEQAAGRLASFVSDPKSAPLEVLQRAAAHLAKAGASSSISSVLVPIVDELTVLASSLSAPQPELALVDALIPSLVAEGAAAPPEEADAYDDLGLSAYARTALFSLRVSEGEEDVLQAQPDLLIHWLYLALLAEDALVSPRAAKHVFHPSSPDVVKAIFSHVVHTLSSTVAAAARGGAADTVLPTVQEVVKGAAPAPSGALAHAAAQLASDALTGDANATRSLQRLITGVVRFGLPSQSTLEQGLRWAHDLAVKGEVLGVAIARALVLEMGEDKLVERLQTDAVVRLAGVNAEDAAVQGMQLLSYILATSPGPEEAEPITSHRAIMGLKALEKWYASDEELPDALAGQIAALGSRFLPIIQTVPGSHWEFLVDAAEMALEMAAEQPKDPANWPAATAAASFFGGLLTYAATNQILAETWNERRGGVYGLVVGFVLSLAPGEAESGASLSSTASPAEEALWDALLPLVAAIPDKAFSTAVEEAGKTDSVDRDLVSLLLAGPTPSVQLLSFRRLSAIIKKRTEDEVVRLAMEAEVASAAQESVQRETVQEELEQPEPTTDKHSAPDTSSEASFSSATADSSADRPPASADGEEEDSDEDSDGEEDGASRDSDAPELEQVPSPPSTDKAPNFIKGLVEALGVRAMPLVNEPEEPSALQVDRRHAWGTLLGWLLLFDHFDGASLPLATALSDRLRRARAVENALLPLTFDTLLPELQAKELDLDLWGIDEVYLNLLDLADPSALSVLAAHVYLRALATVPALVRSWWMGLRDRALTSAVERFTVRYCTPVLAGWEMAEVQAATSTPAAGGALGISGLGVRAAGTHEAVASYTVDEETLEVRVRLPRNFPLAPVSIGDGGRNPPAVPVARWRAWMLATQQLVANRNAPLLDAVALFGRNAEARFAGFEGQECAICYSILSPADHSLPTKPCKTCKNKFHGQCLYKWVTTSGNSTCPLCRSML